MASIFLQKCATFWKGTQQYFFIANEFFKRLEHVIYDNYEWPQVNRFVDDTLGLILKRRDTFLHQKHISITKLDT